MAAERRRFSTALATVLTLAAAGGACWLGAQSAADFIEKRSREDVALALSAAGKDWAEVSADGLQVRLSGTAPTEVDRFRAMTLAASVVDSSRIVDEMNVAALEAMTPPAFKVELLRNDEGISLIGLVPASTDRAALVRVLKSETAAPKVTDLLETADYPVPKGWDDTLTYGLRAAQMATRAKISVEPGAIIISAITDSRAEKGRLESALRKGLPKGVALETQISAPRPVIAPFTLRFLIDDQGARFDACAADNEPGRDRILEAAIAAGVVGRPGCTLGLGAPTPQWADGAVAAIEAVAKLGQASVTLSDADIALSAPAGTDRAMFDAVVGTLEQALPPVFSLRAELEREQTSEEAGPAEFVASLTGTDALSLRGRITDTRMREAVDSFARSRFATVESTLRNDEKVPAGWTVRVIGALEALDALKTGTVLVTPDVIRLSGTSGDPGAAEIAASQLSARLGAGAEYELSIRYDRRLDPALNLPDGAECVRQMNIAMSEAEIGFEPSKSAIAGDPAPTLQRLADIMVDCADFQLEAGGHTDSQGSEGFNADLSRGRAQALVTAMSEAGIEVTNLSSRGYGESQPIASNETEEGREENRRIEFRLLSERPVRTDPLPPPVTIEGVTSDTPAPAPVPDQAATPVPTEPGPEFIGPLAPEAFGPYQPTPAEPVAAQPAAEMQGPPMPVASSSLVPPATVGASEVFQPLDQREENIRVPVQTPDENTPRPAPRPEDGAADADGQAEGE